jgi:ferredoxin
MRRAAARLSLPAIRVPRGLDAALSLLKYPALGVILFLTWQAGELIFRGFDPCYALLSRHGEDITAAAYAVGGGLLAASLFLSVPFCRWLCPLAAVLNPFSRASPARVARDGAACTSCGACARACPMAIPVDEVAVVVHARCTACLDCADACRAPGGGALALRVAPFARRRWSRGAVAAVLVLTLAASVAAAALFPVPPFRFARGGAAAASVTLRVEGLTCRGRAELFVWFLTRDDDLALDGALALEAWPAPGRGRAVVRFDPARSDADAVRRAATEPYFVAGESRWLAPPFRIEGYDPLGVNR